MRQRLSVVVVVVLRWVVVGGALRCSSYFIIELEPSDPVTRLEELEVEPLESVLWRSDLWTSLPSPSLRVSVLLVEDSPVMGETVVVVLWLVLWANAVPLTTTRAAALARMLRIITVLPVVMGLSMG